MASSSRFDHGAVHRNILALCNNVEEYKENSGGILGPFVRRSSTLVTKRKELEKRIEFLIDKISDMEKSELLPVLTKVHSDKRTDFGKLLFAIDTINPALGSRVEHLKELQKSIVELKYVPGDNRRVIRQKIEKSEQLGLGVSTTQENVIALKIAYLKPYLPEPSKEAVKIMASSPALVDWMWDEVKSFNTHQVKEKKEALRFGLEHSGMVELLQRIDGKHHYSTEQILERETSFKNLHRDLPDEGVETLKRDKKGDAQFINDAKRSLFSLNLQKIPLKGNKEKEAAALMERVEANVKDPHFRSMVSVFHQGIIVPAVESIMHNLMQRNHPLENIGQEPNFHNYICIFTNSEGETIYRYINVLGACVKPENRALETKPFDEFYLHIVDCKADETGEHAHVKRYLSPPLSSLEEAKELLLAVFP